MKEDRTFLIASMVGVALSAFTIGFIIGRSGKATIIESSILSSSTPQIIKVVSDEETLSGFKACEKYYDRGYKWGLDKICTNFNEEWQYVLDHNTGRNFADWEKNAYAAKFLNSQCDLDIK